MLEESIKAEQEIALLNADFQTELSKLRTKFLNKKAPLLIKRDKLLKAPFSWHTAILNCPPIASLINSANCEKCIMALTSVVVTRNEKDPFRNFKISLSFKANAYFTNDSLVKDISFDKDGKKTVTVTEINWKPNKKLTLDPPSHSHDGVPCGGHHGEPSEAAPPASKKQKIELKDEVIELGDEDEDSEDEDEDLDVFDEGFFDWFESKENDMEEENMFASAFYESAVSFFSRPIPLEDEHDHHHH